MGKSSYLEKSEFAASSVLFMACDADNAGRMVGRAVLANDVSGLVEVSRRIDVGQEVILLWVENHGGQKISAGGDECTAQVPADALADIEELRADYQFATQLTMTVGVGASLSEAGKSLMAGKFRGKNQVVQYDPSVDQELAASQQHVADGSATEEEKKIGKAYLAPDAAAAAPAAGDPHCEFCAEFEHEHSGDDCVFCQEANAGLDAAAPEAHCQFCEENEHEHAGDDCVLCAEAAAAPAAAAEPHCQFCAETEHEHTGDDCALCQEAGTSLTPADAANEIDDTEIAALPTNNMMDDETSRPADYDGVNTSGDNSNGAPDLADVLKDGLEGQEGQIAKEKVMNMIGQALAGFKTQKAILERAQHMAPELYSSTIMMLKAMIEMGKMLGLQPKEAQSPLEQAQAQVPDAPAQPGQPAAAQGDAAQSPQQ